MESVQSIAKHSETGTTITVYVQPNAARTECVGVHGDALKVRVAARPIDGAANNELIRFMAARCDVPRSSVRILAGREARRKRLHVKGVAAEWLVARVLPQQEKGTVGL